MKVKILTLILAVAIAAQVTAMAAEYKHDWIDNIKNSDATTNRYYGECGTTIDKDIASIRNFIATFDANGGYVDVTNKETNMGKIRRLPILEHTSDYQWEGWYTDPRTKQNQVTRFTFYENGVLYAKREVDEIQADTLMTTDPIYLTDEQVAERPFQRSRAFGDG